jgi:hypothetical protein
MTYGLGLGRGRIGELRGRFEDCFIHINARNCESRPRFDDNYEPKTSAVSPLGQESRMHVRTVSKAGVGECLQLGPQLSTSS